MRYDTNVKAGIEPGIYTVTVATYPQEKHLNGRFVKIEMEFSIEGQDRNIKQGFFPNQLKDMFLALGWAEIEPGIFDGDITEAYGKQFLAELYIEDYDKKDSTGAVIGKGKARKLRNFRPYISETTINPDGVMTPEELKIAWEE